MRAMSAKRLKSSVEPVAICFFWRPHLRNGWMSNWSNHAIAESGVRFATCEHYIMYHKAQIMGDAAMAARVIGVPTPAAAKALGRRVANFDERKWEQQRADVALRAVKLKAEQHPVLRVQLLLTQGQHIAEASPYDSIWGIGCSDADPRAGDPSKWPGLNILGKAWMHARVSLL